MKYTITPVGFKELRKELKKMSADMKKKVNGETYASGLDIQKAARDNLKARKAWDLGNAANSIIVERSPDFSFVEVGPTAPYAIYIEFGTKPHFPPPSALEGWAKRHGFDSAWPICLAIAKHGTPEQPFLFPAFLSIEGDYFNRVRGLLGK